MPTLPDLPPLLEAAVSSIIDAARGASPIESVRAALLECTVRFHALRGLVHEAPGDEVLLHAGEHLTIYHITLTPGVIYPPHNHLMHALIGIYKGAETNLIYPASGGGRLGVPKRDEVSAPAIVHMEPQTIHAVANTGEERSGALHVYFGNLLEVQRQIWMPGEPGPQPFDNARYLEGSRPLAAHGWQSA